MEYVKRIIVLSSLIAGILISCNLNNNSSDKKDVMNKYAEVQIKDTCLYRLLDELIFNGAIDRSRCVFQFFVISDNIDSTEYYLSYALNASELMHFIPAGCFYIRDECILYYTGFDRFFKTKNNEIRKENFRNKRLTWDINLPLCQSEVDRDHWVMMRSKMTRLFTYSSNLKKWTVDIGSDIDILGSTIKQSKEPYWIKDSIENEDSIRE